MPLSARMAESSNPRAASVIDKFIGTQIRIRRSAKGMSQEALAESIGVTFQQIQKYEKGVNRVAAATLLRIAHVFEVEVAAFMPGTLNAGAVEEFSSFETMTALAQPLSRLNGDGRELLVVLAQALATHPRLRA